VIFLVRFWIQPKMNIPIEKGEFIHWWQYGLQKRNQSSRAGLTQFKPEAAPLRGFEGA
jgi:hypothetical protein